MFSLVSTLEQQFHWELRRSGWALISQPHDDAGLVGVGRSRHRTRVLLLLLLLPPLIISRYYPGQFRHGCKTLKALFRAACIGRKLVKKPPLFQSRPDSIAIVSGRS